MDSWSVLVVGSGATVIIFGLLLCRALTVWLAFRTPDLLSILRRGAFGAKWWIGALVGFLVGLAVCLLISQQPCSLLPENFNLNTLIIISAALVLGQVAGVLGVHIAEKENIKITLAYVREWKGIRP